MSKNIIVDTGFWIGYFEEKDSYHKDALELAELIFENKIICPFPSLYEFLNTRFARNNNRLTNYEKLLRKLNIEYIFDNDYRSDTDIGLVQQPGWLLNKSRRFGEFLAEIRQIYLFFSGSCSITEVIEQLYYKRFYLIQ